MPILMWGCSCCEDRAEYPAFVLQEINLMEKLSFDRNIVQFYGAVLSAPAPMLVLEFMEGNTPSALHSLPLHVRWSCSSAHLLHIRWML